MILGMSVATYTLLHTVLSLVGIVAGLVVAGGLVAGTRLDRWAAVFLVTTVLANASGFGFPFTKLIASHVVGAVSLVVLPAVIVADYVKHLAGSWRTTYAVGAAVRTHPGPRAGAVRLAGGCRCARVPPEAGRLEPHRQAHPRHRFLNRRVDLPGSSGIRLAIDALEAVARRSVEPPHQTHVQAEPQVDRERRMAAAREFRGGEVVRPEQHGRPRADLVERTRSDAHGPHRLRVELRIRGAPDESRLHARIGGHVIGDPRADLSRREAAGG